MFGFRGSSLDDADCRSDIKELKKLNVRGVILFDHDIAANSIRNIESPKQLQQLIATLRNELGSDVVVAIDQEGGQVARLDEHNGFLPTVSAHAFAQLVEVDQIQYADRQAKQLADMGIDLNFAPCVDAAIEPSSVIIAGKERAFGPEIEDITICARIMIDAYEQAGVKCCIKHFPGHGSALMDSHLSMCDITKTHTDEEFVVFSRLIHQYKDKLSVMSGHLMDRNVDPKFPASLSQQHTMESLRGVLGFDGVIITDSIDMRAIRDEFGEVQGAALAIEAGSDLVLDGMNAPGFREPGGATRIVESLSKSISKDRLKESSDRLDRFFS